MRPMPRCVAIGPPTVPGVGVERSRQKVMFSMSELSKRNFPRFLPGISVGVLVLVLSGCSVQGVVNWVFGPNRVTEGMDVAFSINILKPPWWWPDEDTFDVKQNPSGKIEKTYFEQNGRPDWLRLYFSREGTVIPYSVLSEGAGLPKIRQTAWIYMERKVEVTFTTKEAVETPITDEVLTLCELGDPDEILNVSTDGTTRHVRYLYRRRGVFITFVNQQKTDTQRVPALPGWMRTSSM